MGILVGEESCSKGGEALGRPGVPEKKPGLGQPHQVSGDEGMNSVFFRCLRFFKGLFAFFVVGPILVVSLGAVAGDRAGLMAEARAQGGSPPASAQPGRGFVKNAPVEEIHHDFVKEFYRSDKFLMLDYIGFDESSRPSLVRGWSDLQVHSGALGVESLEQFEYSGFDYLEGPYPQWDLPKKVRWMNRGKAEISYISSSAGVKEGVIRLKCKTSVEKQQLAVFFNGRQVLKQDMEPEERWLSWVSPPLQVVPGRNVIAFEAVKHKEGHGRTLFVLFEELGLDLTGSTAEEAENRHFVWSTGRESVLHFYLNQLKNIDLLLKCEPLDGEEALEELNLLVNGRSAGTVVFQEGKGAYTVKIPRESLMLGVNALAIQYGAAKDAHAPGDGEAAERSLVRFLGIDLNQGAGDFVFYGGSRKPEYFMDHVVNISRVALLGDERMGVVQKPKTAVEYPKCYIPVNARLNFSLGFYPVAPGEADVHFSVFAKRYDPARGDRGKVIFSETLNPARDKEWKDYSVPLTEFQGEVVTFSFSVESDSDPHRINCVWGQPRISAPCSGKKYNIVLLTFDALRAGNLSYAGYERKTSSHLDEFAKDCVRFDNCFSVAPWTLPSFASFYTSLYPGTHGAGRAKIGNIKNAWIPSMSDYVPLNGHFPTVHTFLKPFGYHARVISDQGHLWPNMGVTADCDIVQKHMINSSKPFFTEDVARFLAGEAASGLPFFLHVHLMPPHDPFFTMSPYDREFVQFERFAEEDHLSFEKGDPVDLFFALKGGVDMICPWGDGMQPDDRKREFLLALYDSSVAASDEFFGKVIDLLRESGLYDESLVVFASDHGEEIFEHDSVGHGHSFYENVIRVPLLMKIGRASCRERV